MPKFDDSKPVKKITRARGTKAQLDALNAGNDVFRKGNGKVGKAKTTDQYYRSINPEDAVYPAAGPLMLRFSGGREYPHSGKPEDWGKVINIPGSKDTPLDPDEEPTTLKDIYEIQDHRAGNRWFHKSGDSKVWVNTKSKNGGTLTWPRTGGAWCETDSNDVPKPVTPRGKK